MKIIIKKHFLYSSVCLKEQRGEGDGGSLSHVCLLLVCPSVCLSSRLAVYPPPSLHSLDGGVVGAQDVDVDAAASFLKYNSLVIAMIHAAPAAAADVSFLTRRYPHHHCTASSIAAVYRADPFLRFFHFLNHNFLNEEISSTRLGSDAVFDERRIIVWARQLMGNH